MKALNEGMQMRSDWLIPLCTGAERLKTADGDKAHPTQKPEALLHRVLVASTRPGDVVLDPFFGTGTTGAVAKRLGRRFIGIEREADYRAAAEARIAAVRPLDADAPPSPPRSAPSRASPSASWSSAACWRRARCCIRSTAGARRKIRADGTLVASDVRGSIHQVGAALEGAPSCNGWTYWHFQRDGVSVPIDFLRQQIRAEMGAIALTIRQIALPDVVAASDARCAWKASGKRLDKRHALLHRRIGPAKRVNAKVSGGKQIRGDAFQANSNHGREAHAGRAGAATLGTVPERLACSWTTRLGRTGFPGSRPQRMRARRCRNDPNGSLE